MDRLRQIILEERQTKRKRQTGKQTNCKTKGEPEKDVDYKSGLEREKSLKKATIFSNKDKDRSAKTLNMRE